MNIAEVLLIGLDNKLNFSETVINNINLPSL